MVSNEAVFYGTLREFVWLVCKYGENVANDEAEELNKQKPTFEGHSKAIPRVYV